MSKLSWAKRASAALLLCAATAIALPAQTLTTLIDFAGTDGADPAGMSLVQGADGNLYGTTFYGGTSNACPNPGCGTVFKITPGGTLTILHNFDNTDGAHPAAALVQGLDGNFYATTISGGANTDGTVFKITPGGTLTTLHNFLLRQGGAPEGVLVRGADGNFYGTTAIGGAGFGGTVYKITPAGTLTTLHNFDVTDGGGPTGLILANDGNFYGTTLYGGTSNACRAFSGCGTVFKITPAGALTTLHNFDKTDGFEPRAALVQATDGNFYGTTAAGGTSSACNTLGNVGCGTVFKITAGGTLTTLHSFASTDGADPAAAIIEATDGSFYGTTLTGGTGSSCSGGCGTIFKITGGGTLTTLQSFDSSDGTCPYGALAQDTNGILYGTTYLGGTVNHSCPQGCGTIFSFGVGLGPFVETQRTFGKVGMAVKILGTDLTGATSVTFNGTPATFTVVGPSLITTTVPAGATTGTVEVVTPSGTLSSNVPFRVLP